MNDLPTHAEAHVYRQQGFGTPMAPQGRVALLIVDLVVGFADPAVFGGGNIPQAIERTKQALKARARTDGPSRTAASSTRPTAATITSSR
jgi:maleamate amidohydrolase